MTRTDLATIELRTVGAYEINEDIHALRDALREGVVELPDDMAPDDTVTLVDHLVATEPSAGFVAGTEEIVLTVIGSATTATIGALSKATIDRLVIPWIERRRGKGSVGELEHLDGS